ncbi:unnamed protein product [Brachionus calyciflorus]|uniref:Uncharacterized protein n=1 Tax=Brachionus calyciflorus TaxID=104777 RepID=A0A813M7G3_9BILA|nr:unnamed protein product [Brachionus calyciflorus]
MNSKIFSLFMLLVVIVLCFQPNNVDSRALRLSKYNRKDAEIFDALRRYLERFDGDDDMDLSREERLRHSSEDLQRLERLFENDEIKNPTKRRFLKS